MAIGRIKVFVANEILFATDLNTEFNNYITNAMTLTSPRTASLRMDGNILILDANLDTWIEAGTDNVIQFRIGGTDRIDFNANGIYSSTGHGLDSISLTASVFESG